jgi:hypothetical protein
MSIRRAYFEIKPTTEFGPVFGFVAASANELSPLLGFLVKAKKGNQSAPFIANLLAIAHFLGEA